MKQARPLITRTYLKAKVYCNVKEGSLKFITEDKKEYNFTDTVEAKWYFEGLGCLGVRMTEFFLTVPEFNKTFHFKERCDRRGV
ncbi:MAG: hypothetical protein ACETVQ_01620 [Candidatus Bathyarchaeia archaeon]